LLELVGPAQFAHIVAKLVDSRESSFLSFTQAVRTSAAGDFGIPTENASRGLIAIFVHIHAILSRLRDVESQIRGVNFKRIIPIKIANTEEHRSY